MDHKLLPALGERVFDVPGEAQVGWNWGKSGKDKEGKITNPDGLVKWKGRDDRVRTPLLKRIL